MKAITQSDVLKQRASHQEWCDQFVTEHLKKYVESMIGRDRILESRDEHFNDIPLNSYGRRGRPCWDDLSCQHYINRDLLRAATGHKGTTTYGWSKSYNVNIAKAAAKAIREEAKQKA